MTPISENQFLQQTGSSCRMDLKTHPTIQHTNMKLDAKYQQAMIVADKNVMKIFFHEH